MFVAIPRWVGTGSVRKINKQDLIGFDYLILKPQEKLSQTPCKQINAILHNELN